MAPETLLREFFRCWRLPSHPGDTLVAIYTLETFHKQFSWCRRLFSAIFTVPVVVSVLRPFSPEDGGKTGWGWQPRRADLVHFTNISDISTHI